ncbi:hypothetical protein MRB53_019514 [Persea americana]|uniref:Uncharacterized protein n=1 Tax=Persea americana TaxID=3435 RepID=A0ACC2KZD7_PERAE|nr:hypothetical protein MRB53_019514 [Persea americana]
MDHCSLKVGLGTEARSGEGVAIAFYAKDERVACRDSRYLWSSTTHEHGHCRMTRSSICVYLLKRESALDGVVGEAEEALGSFFFLVCSRSEIGILPWHWTGASLILIFDGIRKHHQPW